MSDGFEGSLSLEPPAHATAADASPCDVDPAADAVLRGTLRVSNQTGDFEGKPGVSLDLNSNSSPLAIQSPGKCYTPDTSYGAFLVRLRAHRAGPGRVGADPGHPDNQDSYDVDLQGPAGDAADLVELSDATGETEPVVEIDDEAAVRSLAYRWGEAARDEDMCALMTDRLMDDLSARDVSPESCHMFVVDGVVVKFRKVTIDDLGSDTATVIATRPDGSRERIEMEKVDNAWKVDRYAEVP